MRNIQILHFNDVYHLLPRKQEPVGGAARFATSIKEFRAKYGSDSSCILFSGDLFNPSVESSISKGKHMALYQIFINLLRVSYDINCIVLMPFTFFRIRF